MLGIDPKTKLKVAIRYNPQESAAQLKCMDLGHAGRVAMMIASKPFSALTDVKGFLPSAMIVVFRTSKDEDN
jgi:hypothetical protein